MTDPKFKIGDRVKQHATHPDRDYFGVIQYVELSTSPPEYQVRWHRGYASREVETDLQPAPPKAN